MSGRYSENEPSRAEIDVWRGSMVLEFGNDWCGHCRAAGPLIERMVEAAPELRHLRIADGRGRPLGRSFKVKLWPTLVFLRDGVERARLVRPSDSQALDEALSRIL